jgi:hypothetical protein
MKLFKDRDGDIFETFPHGSSIDITHYDLKYNFQGKLNVYRRDLPRLAIRLLLAWITGK